MSRLPGACRDLRGLADPRRAAFLPSYFKTGPGGYAERDRFLGVSVPQIRSVARRHSALSLSDVGRLLRSPWHEDRLLALVILVDQHRGADRDGQLRIARKYLAWRGRVNNWDLVDSSAPYLLGPHLEEFPNDLLRRLARSRGLWDRRIAIVATLHDIRQGNHRRTLEVARLLLRDREDLIHKAVGWMLREVGKRDRPALEGFLSKHHRRMPRTLLRYAIERLPAGRQAAYLRGRA